MKVLIEKEKFKDEIITIKTSQLSIKQLEHLIVIIIATGFLFLIIQTIITKINWSTLVWSPIDYIPAIKPIGIDFRNGIYRPAACILQGNIPPYTEGTNCSSTYPPISFLLGIPFTFLTENSAYVFVIFLLYGAIIGSIFLVYKIGVYIFEDSKNNERILSLIVVVYGSMILIGYPFEFAVERGNYDSFAILLTLLALWIFVSSPKKIWWVVLYLSLATHLKVYPAILFIVFFSYYKKNIILPFFIINFLLSICLGPNVLLNFLKALIKFNDQPYIWIGNHSAISFATLLQNYLPVIPLTWDKIFIIIPALLWISVVLLQYMSQSGKSYLNYMLLFSVTLPLTCIIPSVSHDYKLVVLLPGIILFLAFLSVQYLETREYKWLVIFCLSSILFLLFSQPPFFQHPFFILFNQLLNPMWGIILGNKYPLVVGYEFLVVSACFLYYWRDKKIIS